MHEAATSVSSTSTRDSYTYTVCESDKAGPTNRYTSQGGANRKEYERVAPLFSTDFLKPVVFGGLDGLVTILAIISGAAGGSYSWHIVLVMGFSAVVANAVSLGTGEYLSSLAQREFMQVERRRETWQLKHFKDAEIKEMTSRFISQGMEKTDAKFVVAKMAQYEGFFVNLMVTEEWGLQLPEDDDAKLLTDAFIMAIAFAVFGCIPLLAYCFGPWSVMDDLSTFYAAAIIAGVLIFFLGSMKCSFCTVFWIYSGLETIFVAGAASGMAYLLGSIAANGF